MKLRLVFSAALISTGIGVAIVGPGESSAEADAETPPTPLAAPVPAAPPCDAWQVEYVLNATVRISDTPMGAGDGSYPNGPGKMVLRFESQNGQPAGRAKLVDYQMKDTFTVVSKALAWETRVTADTLSRTTPDACSVSADGVLDGRSLRWSGPWNGMRSDGAVVCDGTFCGKFGAPPPGRSPLHVPPHPMIAHPLEFAPDMRTFTMGFSVVSQQSSPSQTSRIALAGREIRRSCVAAKACP